MSDTLQKIDPRNDPKRRLILILVGAVLLPSLALSYVAIDQVTRLATARKSNDAVRKASESRRLAQWLRYVEEDLRFMARERAGSAARVIGPERLREGRPEVVRSALMPTGSEVAFESLGLEVSSSLAIRRQRLAMARGVNVGRELPDERSPVLEPQQYADGVDSIPWSSDDGWTFGRLRFKLATPYLHGTLIPEFFETKFDNPRQSLVVRVTGPGGSVVYENSPTPDGRFAAQRQMQWPMFKGLKLFVRQRDRPIEQDVDTWKTRILGLIGLLEAILGAGLFLVYRNARARTHSR